MERNRGVVNRLADSLIDKLEKMETFTLEQAPDLCKEIVLAEKGRLENSLILSSVFAFLSITGLVSTLVFFDESLFRTTLAVIYGIIILDKSISTLKYILSLRILKIAPKAFILHKLKG